MGHALHHLLAHVEVDHATDAEALEWDAVEFPSQFLERWVYDRATFASIVSARHGETGAPLPARAYESVCAQRAHNGALALLSRLHHAHLDLALHMATPPVPVEAIAARMSADYEMVPTDPTFLCAFTHILGGGDYDAGYYSYVWAEVLAADAFEAFFSVDGADAHLLGRRFRAVVLEAGAAAAPMAELFRRFRGRKPSQDALLRWYGICD